MDQNISKYHGNIVRRQVFSTIPWLVVSRTLMISVPRFRMSSSWEFWRRWHCGIVALIYQIYQYSA